MIVSGWQFLTDKLTKGLSGWELEYFNISLLQVVSQKVGVEEDPQEPRSQENKTAARRLISILIFIGFVKSKITYAD